MGACAEIICRILASVSRRFSIPRSGWGGAKISGALSGELGWDLSKCVPFQTAFIPLRIWAGLTQETFYCLPMPATARDTWRFRLFIAYRDRSATWRRAARLSTSLE